MSALENIVVGKSSIPSLGLTVVLLIAIPLIFFFYWRLKHKEQTKLGWLFAGAAGFLISARVLEQGVHYVCILGDNPVARFINGNTAAYVLYGITMAGVFEECGRYIVMKYLLKKNRTRENAVLYGIGHGGIEVLAVLLPAMILYLVIAVLFSSGDVGQACKMLNITEETAVAALPSIQAAASFTYGMMAMNVLERISAMVLHIGLSVIVFYGIKEGKKICLPIAILLHMLMDFFPALYQRGVLGLWVVELWAALWAVLTLAAAVKLYRKMEMPSDR